MAQKLKLDMSAGVRKKIRTIMKKMKFSDEGLFVRYCIGIAYRPYATKNEKTQITNEIKLIRAYEAKKAKKK